MSTSQHTPAVNRARLAGAWYSRSADDLAHGIEESLAAVSTAYGPVRGAVVPHAGLAFSGRGLAECFANVDATAIQTVVALAPSHYARLKPNTLYSAPFTEHETPLGPISGETALPSAARPAPEAVEQEHALEMLFPYVRHTLDESVKLAAFLVPEVTSVDQADSLAGILFDWIRADGRTPEETLVLVSSDFSHYGPRFGYVPFGTHPVSEVEQQVERDDRALADAAADLDTDAVWERITGHPISVCGRYPILVATRLFARLHYRGKTSLYYNSNSLRSPETDFVCYASVLFTPGAST